ncbi:MAG: substrate-binding domain-containing protein [Lachnospiraceae bacterium]|nr:substrate-binding domain-containing protein [Lachnospiraceae bacterium]
MKSDKILLIAAITILLSVTGFVGWQILNMGRQEEPVKVSVIVNNSSLDRWTNFKEGLEQGGVDFGIRINIVSTSEISSMSAEKEIIEKEISNGAGALIVELYNSYNQAAYLEELSAEIPLVLVGTDTSPEDVFYSVTADNYNLGQTLAKELIKDLDGRSAKVGIIAGNQEQLSMFQRLSGFRDGLKGSGVSVVWQISGYNDAGVVAEMSEYQKENHADFCVGLGNSETEKAIDYYNVFNGNFEGVIYGVGCSEEAAYYLDNGLIKKLIVPDEFDMGYQSALSIAKRVSYITEAEKHIETVYKVIDAESLYSPENEMLIFPEKP